MDSIQLTDTSTPTPPFIDPPFQFNAAGIAQFAPELTGYRLLSAMAHRLGWPSVSNRKILDYGCGIRFARTIANLDLDVALYAGVDVNPQSIQWFQENLKDSRFKFDYIDDQNPMYNPTGQLNVDFTPLESYAQFRFDVACMFSVITHQRPHEARRIFSILRRIMDGAGKLYFTALLDRGVADYQEGDEQVCVLSVYHPDYLVGLLAECGWAVERIYEPSQFQQFALICHCV